MELMYNRNNNINIVRWFMTSAEAAVVTESI